MVDPLLVIEMVSLIAYFDLREMLMCITTYVMVHLAAPFQLTSVFGSLTG
jgi:hypothetical protein